MNAEFVRGLAVVYAVAIGSYAGQIVALAGSRGISPIASVHARLIRDVGAARGFCSAPSLLWCAGTSDGALRWLPRLGALAAALLALCGGLVVSIGGDPTCAARVGGASACDAAAAPLFAVTLSSRALFGTCWATLLSLTHAARDFSGFPWDCLLLEAGFLAMFLPTVAAPAVLRVARAGSAVDFTAQLAASGGLAPLAADVHPVLSWAFRWLLFRIMFGFGKKKFGSADWTEHWDYIRAFFISQPMPSPLALFAFRYAPRAIYAPSLVFMFVAEMVVPFLYFATGYLRIGAGLVTAALMLGIQCTGNFGYFNILTIVLTIPLLDADASVFDVRTACASACSGVLGGGAGGGVAGGATGAACANELGWLLFGLALLGAGALFVSSVCSLFFCLLSILLFAHLLSCYSLLLGAGTLALPFDSWVRDGVWFWAEINSSARRFAFAPPRAAEAGAETEAGRAAAKAQRAVYDAAIAAQPKGCGGCFGQSLVRGMRVLSPWCVLQSLRQALVALSQRLHPCFCQRRPRTALIAARVVCSLFLFPRSRVCSAGTSYRRTASSPPRSVQRSASYARSRARTPTPTPTRRQPRTAAGAALASATRRRRRSISALRRPALAAPRPRGSAPRRARRRSSSARGSQFPSRT